MTHMNSIELWRSSSKDLWENSSKEYFKISKCIPYYDAVATELAGMADPYARIILDFGCGHGRFSRVLIARLSKSSNFDRSLILVDQAADMLSLTQDVADPGMEVVRLADSQKLECIPRRFHGKIDTIACSASFHLLRNEDLSLDGETLVRRAGQLLRPGGELLVNIPDQAYEFGDGWSSEFYSHAKKLWEDGKERSLLPKYDTVILNQIAKDYNFKLEIHSKFIIVKWSEFINFYRIPAIGAIRISNRSQEERLRILDTIAPQFDSIQYRWAFARFQKN